MSEGTEKAKPLRSRISSNTALTVRAKTSDKLY